MRARRWILLGVAVAVLVVHASQSEAQGAPAKCKVFEIKASNAGKGLDKELEPLEKKLKKPPFSAWDTFELLAKHAKSIAVSSTQILTLKTGGKLSLMYRGSSSAKGKKLRLRIKFAIDDKKSKRIADGTVSLDSGDWAIVGGQTHKDGTYIVAFSCTSK